MPTAAREAVKTSPKIFVKSVHSVESMRRPQASFEAQPRIARLLAPKMGIGPYIHVGKYIRIRRKAFSFCIFLHLYAATPQGHSWGKISADNRR